VSVVGRDSRRHYIHDRTAIPAVGGIPSGRGADSRARRGPRARSVAPLLAAARRHDRRPVAPHVARRRPVSWLVFAVRLPCRASTPNCWCLSADATDSVAGDVLHGGGGG